jgi:hypothetical protein
MATEGSGLVPAGGPDPAGSAGFGTDGHEIVGPSSSRRRRGGRTFGSVFDAGGYERVRVEAEAEVRATRAAVGRFALALVVFGAVVVLRMTYVFC